MLPVGEFTVDHTDGDVAIGILTASHQFQTGNRHVVYHSADLLGVVGCRRCTDTNGHQYHFVPIRMTVNKAAAAFLLGIGHGADQVGDIVKGIGVFVYLS